MKKLAVCGGLLVVAFCVAEAKDAVADTTSHWTTVGSVGIVDSKDAGEIATDGILAKLSFAQPGQQEATIRYPITLPLLDQPADRTRWVLTVRYQDGDTPLASTQRILVHLKELMLDSGAVTTVATIDTDDGFNPPVADWQVKSVTKCDPRLNADAAYFIEATFTSDESPLAPAVSLGGIRVDAFAAAEIDLSCVGP